MYSGVQSVHQRTAEIRPFLSKRADWVICLGAFCGKLSSGFYRGIAVLVVQRFIGLRPRHGVLRRHNHAVGQVQGTGIGDVGILAQGNGTDTLFLGSGETLIVVVSKIGHIQLAHDVRADLLMEIEPASMLKDKIGAVALPQHVAVGIFMAIEPAENDAGGDEAATGGFAVVGDFNDVGEQGVDRSLHQGTGVLAADLRIDFLDVQRVLHGHVVVGGDRALPYLVPAPHTAKDMAPGAPGIPAPDLTPREFDS